MNQSNNLVTQHNRKETKSKGLEELNYTKKVPCQSDRTENDRIVLAGITENQFPLKSERRMDPAGGSHRDSTSRWGIVRAVRKFIGVDHDLNHAKKIDLKQGDELVKEFRPENIGRNDN